MNDRVQPCNCRPVNDTDIPSPKTCPRGPGLSSVALSPLSCCERHREELSGTHSGCLASCCGPSVSETRPWCLSASNSDWFSRAVRWHGLGMNPQWTQLVPSEAARCGPCFFPTEQQVSLRPTARWCPERALLLLWVTCQHAVRPALFSVTIDARSCSRLMSVS